MAIFLNRNLFDSGNLDVEDALPNLGEEQTPEAVSEIAQAKVEAEAIESQIEASQTGLEDLEVAAENLDGLVEQHEENIVQESNMPVEQVQENMTQLAEGVESVAGFLKLKNSEMLYRALGVNVYNSGLNSIANPSMSEYREGIEGVKTLATSVWAKIKVWFQRFIQWIQKWIAKTIVWIKGYSKKAEKLEKEAKEIKDDAELKTDKLSPLAKLLVTEDLSLKNILDSEKEVMDNIKKQSKQLYEEVKDEKGSTEYKKAVVVNAFSTVQRTTTSKEWEEISKETIGEKTLVVGLSSTKNLIVCELGGDLVIPGAYSTKELKNPENVKKKGSDVKKAVLAVCKEAKDSSKKAQEILNSNENHYREMLKKFEVKLSGDFDPAPVKILMAWSKFAQKALIASAYTPGYFLAAAASLVKGCEKGGSSDDKKEEKKD